MVDDYSRFIGLLPRKKRVKGAPAIEAWGSDEDILPGYGLDLSPEAVGTTDAGEPITMDEPRISRTVRPTVEFGPTTITRGGRTSLLNAPESRVALTQVAADGAAPSPLLAQLEAVQGPASALGQQSAGKLYQDYIAAKGGFAQPEEAAQESQEVAERTAQGAADTSRATSSDGPDTSGIFRRAAMDAFGNVGRALRGEATMRVAPEEQARAEMQRWLASKAQREAETGRLAQQERLAQMQAMLGLSREQAATERAKMEAESRERVAQIGAESRAEAEKARQGRKPVGGPAADAAAQARLDAKRTADEAKAAAKAEEEKRKATEGMPFGYRLKPGANPSKAQREDATKAVEQREAVRPAIEHLERLTSAGVGRLMDPTARAEVRQMAQQIGTAIRSMENLGVPSGPDMKIQLDLIGDPTSAVNEVAGTLPKLMSNLKDYFDRKANTRLGVLGIEKEPTAPAGRVLLRDLRNQKSIPMTREKAEEFVAKDSKRFSIEGG